MWELFYCRLGNTTPPIDFGFHLSRERVITTGNGKIPKVGYLSENRKNIDD